MTDPGSTFAPGESPVFDALPVVALDRSGAVTAASPAVDAAGTTPEELATGGLDAIVHAADRARVASAFVAVADGDRRSAAATFRLAVDEDRYRTVEFVHGGDAAPVLALLPGRPDQPWAWRLGGALSALGAEVLSAGSVAAAVGGLLRWLSAVGYGRPGFYLLADGEASFELVTHPSTESVDTAAVPPGVRDAFRSGTPARVSASALPGELAPSSEGSEFLAVPVGDHGVVVASLPAGDDGDVDRHHGFALGVQAAGVALDRVSLVEAVERQRRVLRESTGERDRLADLLATLRDTEERLLRADSVEEVHRSLCEGLATTTPFEFVWTGENDVANDELVPVEWAGTGRAYLDHVPLGLDEGTDSPVVRTFRSGRPTLVEDVAAGTGTTAWRREALSCGFRSVLAVPVGDEEVTRGVLAVYAREASAFDARTEHLLAHLGRVAGFVSNALELRGAMLANTTVQLELRVPTGTSSLAAFATALGRPLDLESAIPLADDSTRVFFTAPVERAAVETAVATVGGVGAVTAHTRRTGEELFEVTVTDRTVPSVLASLGGLLTEATVTGEAVRAIVEVDRSVDVREFVDSVRSVYPGTELLARRIHDRPVGGEASLRDGLLEELTDRQLRVFEAAHYGGFFEWPREHTGGELAESLGMSQPTFSRHLRTAERTLARLLFEPGDEDDGG